MEPTQSQLKELKQVEREMLCVFVQICERLNLRYFVVGGTLLGAVRHQGFIPWDDDIDVCMPRNDYAVFLKKAPSLLPKHLFIQTTQSDPAYLMGFAKMRNSNTTFIETTVKHLPINHGVYIDIFPLDYYPQDVAEQQRLEKKKTLYNTRIATCFYSTKKRSLKVHLFRLILKLRYPSVAKIIQKREALYRSVPESTWMVNHSGAWGKKEIIPAEWSQGDITLTFENMQVTAPAHYHEWLTHLYGDYMQYPPESERMGHHYAEVIDLYKPYTEYTKQNNN